MIRSITVNTTAGLAAFEAGYCASLPTAEAVARWNRWNEQEQL